MSFYRCFVRIQISSTHCIHTELLNFWIGCQHVKMWISHKHQIFNFSWEKKSWNICNLGSFILVRAAALSRQHTGGEDFHSLPTPTPRPPGYLRALEFSMPTLHFLVFFSHCTQEVTAAILQPTFSSTQPQTAPLSLFFLHQSLQDSSWNWGWGRKEGFTQKDWPALWLPGWLLPGHWESSPDP